MTRLTKNSNKIYIPGSPGIPASSGQPYLPPRTVTQYVTECSYGPDETALLAAGWTRQWVPSGNGQYGGSYQWTPPAGWSGGVQIPYVYACRQVPVQVTLPAQPYIPPTPAVPPTPAQFYHDNNLGWNSGAESIGVMRSDGRVSFQVGPSSAGVVIGLNAEGSGYGYHDIQHAFRFMHGVAEVIELGVSKAMLGAFVADDVFAIERHAGSVTYFKNGIEVYSSEAESTGPVVLDVSMYSGGDYVFNPELIGFSWGELDAPMPVMLGGNYEYGEAELTVPAPRMYTEETMLVVPAQLLLGGNYEYGEADLTIPAPTLETPSEVDELPWFGIADLAVVAPTLVGVMEKRVSGQADITLPAPALLGGNYLYGEADLAVAAPRLDAGTAAVEAMIAGVCRCAFTHVASADRVTMLAGRSLGFFATATGVVAVEMLAGRSPGLVASIKSTFVATMIAGRSPGLVVEVVDYNHEAWVLNIRNGGFTRYEAYPINSMTHLRGVNLAATPDGIYELEGVDDSGEPVQAVISFGKQRFDTSALKGVPNAYAGVSSDGLLSVRVTVDNGESYVYRARDSQEGLTTQRFDFGRGLRANYFDLDMFNEDGGDFELSTFELLPTGKTRRI